MSKPKVADSTSSDTSNRTISILSIIFGLLALVFSAQANYLSREANRIAMNQVMAQTVILDAAYGNWGVIGDGRVACAHAIRLANFGGVADSVVGFSADITYGNESLRVEGKEGFADSEELPSGWPFSGTAIVFTDDAHARIGISGISQMISDDYILDLPVSISAHAATDLIAVVESRVPTGKPLPRWTLVRDRAVRDLLGEGHKVPVLEAQYSLRLQDGRSLTTLKLPCAYRPD